MRKLFFMFAISSAVVAAVRVGAQTVPGDILRGQGRFLEGAGWYNFNTARADRINVETWKAYNREVQRIYREYMMDRAHHIQARRGKTNKVQDEIQRKFEESQRRYRENPSPDDILSGNALNALAGDLADPTIGPSSWRGVQVDLPSDITLTSMAFKIADTKKSRLSQSTVAVDRMLVKADKDDRWPIWFRRPEIKRECDAYEKAIKSVVDKCRKQVELQAADYDRLRETVDTLKKTVETVIPNTDNQRGQARDYVKRLDQATKIFAEQSYAEQLIRDVSEHKAANVGQLLAFMREYKLMFAEPGDSPEMTSMYQDLYSLLRKQRDGLGIKYVVPGDAFAKGSIWVSTDPGKPIRLSVEDRRGREFRARWTNGRGPQVLEIRGEIGDDTVVWRSTDVRVIGGPQPKAQGKAQGRVQGKAQGKAQTKAAPVTEAHGSFNGDEIEFAILGGPQKNEFVLRKSNR